ncbi:MAG: His/Gly/Thr/Pro-type tRNA ligase C-terminal domain-containing protein, partial [Flavobacteriales bacterium]
LKELRAHGIPSEIYPDNSKMKKQMTYANNKNIPFVALVGENELANNSITLKNMETGDQNSYTIKELVIFFNATRF